ncbi:MAG: hypothetical protein ACTS77_01195 [Arsenophonus sp. NC-TX2-MAG3]
MDITSILIYLNIKDLIGISVNSQEYRIIEGINCNLAHLSYRRFATLLSSTSVNRGNSARRLNRR